MNSPITHILQKLSHQVTQAVGTGQPTSDALPDSIMAGHGRGATSAFPTSYTPREMDSTAKEDWGPHSLFFLLKATESWNSLEVIELGAGYQLAFGVFHPHLHIAPSL